MFFIMISVPGALALYYAVSNLVAVGQQAYLLRRDEDELEELAEEATEKPVNHKKSPKKANASKWEEVIWWWGNRDAYSSQRFREKIMDHEASLAYAKNTSKTY